MRPPDPRDPWDPRHWLMALVLLVLLWHGLVQAGWWLGWLLDRRKR